MAFREFKKPLFAAILSFAVPGLGQAYSNQLFRGIALGASYPLLVLALAWMKLPSSFMGLVALAAIQLGYQCFVAIDAWQGVRLPRNEVTKSSRRWIAYLCLVAIACGLNIVLENGMYFDRILGMRFYRIPSSGMEPTILVGERIAVNLKGFDRDVPHQGDLVMFEHSGSTSKDLLIKRIGGIGGDIVDRNKQGVFINDNRACEPNPDFEDGSGPSPIPPNQFFVLGDSRPWNFDSCYPEFGLVDRKQIRGRPLYIYWSSYLGRVGLPL